LAKALVICVMRSRKWRSWVRYVPVPAAGKRKRAKQGYAKARRTCAKKKRERDWATRERRQEAKANRAKRGRRQHSKVRLEPGKPEMYREQMRNKQLAD